MNIKLGEQLRLYNRPGPTTRCRLDRPLRAGCGAELCNRVWDSLARPVQLAVFSVQWQICQKEVVCSWLWADA